MYSTVIFFAEFFILTKFFQSKKMFIVLQLLFIITVTITITNIVIRCAIIKYSQSV